MTLDINQLRQYCGTEQVIYSKHFVDRCRERDIQLGEAENAILTGEIIEEYPNDYPFPSCLILGTDFGHNSLHVVCSQSKDYLYMISVYHPSPDKWESDMRTRKGGTKP